MKRAIESEAQFVRKQLLFLLKIPWIIILVLLGKKKSSALFGPFHKFINFLFEPRITILLILCCTLVFFYQVFFMPAEVFERLVFQPEYLFQLNFVPMVVSWFMHGSISHLFGNMLVLYIFGRILEKRFSYKFLFIYFGAAVISDVFASLFGQGGIGASGAISGLVAAAILTDPFYLTFLIFGIPLPIMLIGWISILSDILGVFSAEETNIGYFAHLGGYLSITLLVYLLNQQERDRMKKGLVINIVFIILLFFLFFLL